MAACIYVGFHITSLKILKTEVRFTKFRHSVFVPMAETSITSVGHPVHYCFL